MSIELAGIRLDLIHKIVTLEQAALVSHRIPGLEGNVVQNLGRDSVRLRIEGIFYGAAATEDLEALRDVYKQREPVDFLAEVVGQAYFGQVILEQFQVFQLAGEPEQFSYRLTLVEYIIPPEPETSGLGLPEVDASILDEAQGFMDTVMSATSVIDALQDIPLGSIPDFVDPTKPLASTLEQVNRVTTELPEILNSLESLLLGSE